ncbi:flavin monoamine oxidase family protein [Streptomyces sp. NPDC127178]|uniref:flavin monoamine oxidase family protein n=1 Tax=unclassified Streptomyces TaxID=2593676 RepID=UPI00363B924E
MVPYELPDTPAQGFTPNRGRRKRVVVIGAGIAGLVAGMELARQRHEPVILEAQTRVGGRVHTLRNFAPGLYAEAGAMRIPQAHELTLAYCRSFGLELRPFHMECTTAPVYIAGRRTSRDHLYLNYSLGDPSPKGTGLGRTYSELLRDVMGELQAVRQSEGDVAAIDFLAGRYGKYSIRDFLIEQGLSEDAIELYGLMSLREANMNSSVVEHLREILGRAFEDMQEIVGGMDRLPNAFYRYLRRHIRLGAQVLSVEQDENGVTVHYKSKGKVLSERGDYCICTVPFGVLRHFDFRPPLSRGKYRAIRSLNYNPSTKIFLQVRRRFWEEKGIVGGSTPTDLPIRRIVYPSYSSPEEERGVLLASYTWGQDAARWGALNSDDRILLALKDVAKVYPEVIDEVEGGTSYAWYNDDPFAVGAFALFEPGQEMLLHKDIVKPEGRVYFAGEHCSLWHAWIQGALESGIAAALSVHDAPPGKGE